MERGFAAVAEDIADIKSTMVTKTEFNEAVEKLDDRLTAVESKIGGVHNRIDDEALKRAKIGGDKCKDPVLTHHRSRKDEAMLDHLAEEVARDFCGHLIVG